MNLCNKLLNQVVKTSLVQFSKVVKMIPQFPPSDHLIDQHLLLSKFNKISQNKRCAEKSSGDQNWAILLSTSTV